MYLLGDAKGIALDQSSHVKENKICVAAQPKGKLGVLYFLTVTSTWQCHRGPWGIAKALQTTAQAPCVPARGEVKALPVGGR